MYTQLVEEKDLHQIIRRHAEEIGRVCSSGIAVSDIGYNRDPVQTLLLTKKSSKESLLFPIIESSAIEAEKLASGAGETFLNIFSHSMIGDLGRKIIGSDLDQEWSLILDQVKKCSIPARKNDIEKILSDDKKEISFSIIDQVFKKLNAGDRVLIRKSPMQDLTISRESGYCFEGLDVDPRFLSKGSWTRKNVRTVLIDGIIESVSEIHRFLEEMSKNKTPSIIFCLNCLPDVSETLVKNYLMGNLDTILVKIPVTEFHINTLVDLGIILGLEPISASTGETISLGILGQKEFAQKITITRNKISIEDQKRPDRILSHIRELRSRVEKDINLFSILEGRINSLSSSTIHVNVGMNYQKMDPNLIEKLDRDFRSLPKIFKSGFIEKNDFQEFSKDKIDLLFGKKHVASAEKVIQSIKIFLSTRETIYSAAIGIKAI